MLEHHPVRGFWVRLDGAWRELRSHQHYPPPVEALLGEAVTASVLLAATLKFQGTLTLQLTGRRPGASAGGAVHASISSSERLPAPKRCADRCGASFRQLVGRRAGCSSPIEAEERSARYQGIVALQGDDLAGCLENYFATSEQLPTRLALAADAPAAGGVLLQKMPGSPARRVRRGGALAAGVGRAAASVARPSMRRCCSSAGPSRCCSACAARTIVGCFRDAGALRVPLQRRPCRAAAALARPRRDREHHRRAGRGHGDLRVLRAAVSLRCDRRRTAVYRRRQPGGAALGELMRHGYLFSTMARTGRVS